MVSLHERTCTNDEVCRLQRHLDVDRQPLPLSQEASEEARDSSLHSLHVKQSSLGQAGCKHGCILQTELASHPGQLLGDLRTQGPHISCLTPNKGCMCTDHVHLQQDSQSAAPGVVEAVKALQVEQGSHALGAQ